MDENDLKFYNAVKNKTISSDLLTDADIADYERLDSIFKSQQPKTQSQIIQEQESKLPNNTKQTLKEGFFELAGDYAKSKIMPVVEDIKQHPFQTANTLISTALAPETFGTSLLVGAGTGGAASVADKVWNGTYRNQTGPELITDVGSDAMFGGLFGGLGNIVGRALKSMSGPERIIASEKAMNSPEGKQFMRLSSERVPEPIKTSTFNPETGSYVDALDYTPTKQKLAEMYQVPVEEVPTFEAAKARTEWKRAFDDFSERRISEDMLPKLTLNDIEDLIKFTHPKTTYLLNQLHKSGTMDKLTTPLVERIGKAIPRAVNELPYSGILGTSSIPRLVRGVGVSTSQQDNTGTTLQPNFFKSK